MTRTLVKQSAMVVMAGNGSRVLNVCSHYCATLWTMRMPFRENAGLAGALIRWAMMRAEIGRVHRGIE